MGKYFFSIHHIGGRRGTSALNQDYFQQDTCFTFYDSDPECLEQIKTITKNKNTVVLPYCFGETQQRIPFHLNVDPTTNSLYLLNEDMKDAYLYQYYPLYGPFDFVFGDVIRSEKTIEVDVVSMDYLYKDKKADFINRPPPISYLLMLREQVMKY